MSRVDERTLTEEQVRQEHVASVNQPAHWVYLFSVLVGGTLLMVAFIALIAGGS
jgi:hypothetical protein